MISLDGEITEVTTPPNKADQFRELTIWVPETGLTTYPEILNITLATPYYLSVMTVPLIQQAHQKLSSSPPMP
jgi:hypothetical protein